MTKPTIDEMLDAVDTQIAGCLMRHAIKTALLAQQANTLPLDEMPKRVGFLGEAYNCGLDDAANMIETKVVNVNGITDGRSGSLINDPFHDNRDSVRGTYADAIRAMKVKPCR